MLKRFIERPVLSSVISVLIAILGILGIMSLPVTQYPEIAPPQVVVTATYLGASAEVVLNSVVIPLEEQINGVENMTYMTSTAGNDGTANITVYFEQGTNPDIAAVNVQNRVSRATPLLPEEVTRSGVVVAKSQSGSILVVVLSSDNPDYDEKFLENYAHINLIPQIKRVNGVGDTRVFSNREYAMRIWLKPNAMASYKLVPEDIRAALAEQNVVAAPGQFGENGNETFQYIIKYKGRLKDAQEFGEIVVQSDQNGQILRLKDIADVELGSVDYATSSKVDGKPASGFAISQTAGSNAKEVIEESIKILDQASKEFPEGMSYETFINANDFLDASIEKVLSTLVEAFFLVFIVVFVFLQDFRSTLIPAIAVPVAIVGTFFFLGLFGFTINLLTLFALVLAIGIVVDDAIVVVEAVHAKLDAGYKSSRQATIDALSEITGAIISITLVMAAVFVPVSFVTGSAGVFFKQFGLTLAVAILISAVNALTLSPALCALILKPHSNERTKGKGLLQRFHKAFNAAFEVTTLRYVKGIQFLSVKKWLTLSAVGLFFVLFFVFMQTTPKSFVPGEDSGVIISDITLPPSSSLERTEELVSQVEEIARNIPEVQNIYHVVGRNLLNGRGSNHGFLVLRLKPWSEREGAGQDAGAIVKWLSGKTNTIHGAEIIHFMRPTVSGFGFSDGFEFQLQDKTGGDINEFSALSDRLIKALNQRPEIRYASTSFDPNFPQFELNVNVPRAKEAGLAVSDVLSAFQGYYGGVYASNFNQFGKQYRVLYQANPNFRASPEGLKNIFVRNANGEMAPISGFISLDRVYGPQALSRFNLFTAIRINGAPNEGFSSGNAIAAIEEVAQEILPPGYSYEFSGITREEISAGTQTLFIFLLVIVFIYFLLAAQYESYLLPLAVLFSLPIGLTGTFLFIYLFGIDNNIFVQITLIMLVGLLAKNAILIVEFAVERYRKGMEISQAALEGAKARFRPILMTSFAFTSGLLPLMFSTGVGANSNQSIGAGAVGGMLIGTVFGVMVIPVLYIIFQTLHEKIAGRPAIQESASLA